MGTVTHLHRSRQMAAGQAALMRWYPSMSLRMVDAIRLRRPGYPLIICGQRKQGRAIA